MIRGNIFELSMAFILIAMLTLLRMLAMKIFNRIKATNLTLTHAVLALHHALVKTLRTWTKNSTGLTPGLCPSYKTDKLISGRKNALFGGV